MLEILTVKHIFYSNNHFNLEIQKLIHISNKLQPFISLFYLFENRTDSKIIIIKYISDIKQLIYSQFIPLQTCTRLCRSSLMQHRSCLHSSNKVRNLSHQSVLPGDKINMLHCKTNLDLVFISKYLLKLI